MGASVGASLVSSSYVPCDDFSDWRILKNTVIGYILIQYPFVLDVHRNIQGWIAWLVQVAATARRHHLLLAVMLYRLLVSWRFLLEAEVFMLI